MQRVVNETFGPRSSEQFQPLQQRESVRLALEFLQEPENWEVILDRYDHVVMVLYESNMLHIHEHL